MSRPSKCAAAPPPQSISGSPGCSGAGPRWGAPPPLPQSIGSPTPPPIQMDEANKSVQDREMGSSLYSDDSNTLDPIKVINKYIAQQNFIDSIVKQLVSSIKSSIEAGPSRRCSGPRKCIQRDHEGAHLRLVADYFADDPLYPAKMFRTRFRMSRNLFLRIKCTAAIRMLAYGTPADALDEYLKIGKSTALECLDKFALGVIELFGGEYLHLEFFVLWEEGCRKDVERAFGVLQSRFNIVRRPARLWKRKCIGNIMTACIIIHNMIVEDEKEMAKFPIDLNEDGGTSIALPPEARMGGGISFPAVLRRKATLRHRPTHVELKKDLVEHIWRLFGSKQNKRSRLQ